MAEQRRKSRTGERKEANRKAGALAIVAGIFLLVEGLTGAAAWQAVKDYVTATFPGNASMELVFGILILLASIGGILVIIGGGLFMKEKVGGGKALILLGVGMGLIGLIITLLVVMEGKETLHLASIGLGFVGIVLSVAARMKAQKVE